MFSDKDIERFWSKVDKKDDTTACWEWKTGCFDTGYGMFSYKCKSIGAHKMSMMIYLNREIENGKHILHSCDNRKCCNPHHLREGTHKENMEDRTERNKYNVGEKHFNSKLSNEDVNKIREEYQLGNTSYNKLSKKYNISKATIYQIITNKQRKDETYIKPDIKNKTNSKLTLEQVKVIRQRFQDEKITHKQLAIEYNVGRATISDIIKNRTWNN